MSTTRRKVTVHNTVGNNFKEIYSSASTWSELQNDLSNNGISYDGMKAVIGENQNTLESTQAQLIEGDMTLFLVPNKVKSGSDEGLIDWEDGISWHEVEPDDYSSIGGDLYKTSKDLALARVKYIKHNLDELVNYLTKEQKMVPSDPKIQNLTNMADEIKKNMNLFD
jgi:hypothetical protein